MINKKSDSQDEDMQDDEFLAQFENCRLPKELFKHKNHLHLAWLYLSQNSLDQALLKVSQGIKRYANSLGAGQIYHETLTRFWVLLVHQAMQTKASHFEEFIKMHPSLLDKDLPLQYYSASRLESALAGKQWLEPDLKPLPKEKNL